MDFANEIIWIFITYLLGSVPTAYLVGKKVRNIDIREHGSGNVGATNVFRVIGKQWGSFVLFCDILKGFIATAILATTSNTFLELSPILRQLIFAIPVICGHAWTPWLSFKGGKGVATSAGALLGILPLGTISALLIWGIVFVISHYVSLASIVAAACFPLLVLILYRYLESFPLILGISLILTGFLIYNHRANIARLRRGEENRISFGEEKK